MHSDVITCTNFQVFQTDLGELVPILTTGRYECVLNRRHELLLVRLLHDTTASASGISRGKSTNTNHGVRVERRRWQGRYDKRRNRPKKTVKKTAASSKKEKTDRTTRRGSRYQIKSNRDEKKAPQETRIRYD